MVPTAVRNSLSTTHNTMNDTNRNNISPSSATSRSVVSSNFGVYQQISIGSSDTSIRTLIHDVINANPYRKALIVKLFFHQTMNLSDTPSMSFSDLMSTIASYFGLNTEFTEREAETAGINIRNAFPLFLTCRASAFLTFPVNPLQLRIQFVVPQTLLTLLFVLSLRLSQLISSLLHHLYPLNFLSVYLNHLALLPLIRM